MTKTIKTVVKMFALVTGSFSAFMGCGDDDAASVKTPETYSFTRDQRSTVSFSGQTTRILMGEEIIDAFLDTAFTEARIDAMFAHKKGSDNFKDADLNASDKSVRSKTAASSDFFSANTAAASAIKEEFDSW
ncbi:MAG: DUF4856 domain-containing protein, partial [Ekhidna sp.]|nr:DUF4856 domain-containing protein [Ekhidna sp.]